MYKRQPLLGGTDVAGELLLRDRSQFAQEPSVVHSVNGTRPDVRSRDQVLAEVTGA